jgi:hypothetical protein
LQDIEFAMTSQRVQGPSQPKPFLLINLLHGQSVVDGPRVEFEARSSPKGLRATDRGAALILVYPASKAKHAHW